MQSTVATGSLSTSATIEWALAHLLKYPHCMKRCYEEMDTVVGRRRCVEEADIPNLPYLRAVVKETFRLTPTGPLLLPHFTTSDCKVLHFIVVRLASPSKLTPMFAQFFVAELSNLFSLEL